MRRAFLSVLGVAACALSVTSAAAAEAADEEELPYSLSAEVAMASKYVWRGSVISDGLVFQDTFTAGWNGLSLIVFGNVDLYDASASEGGYNEFDYTLDYTWQPKSVGLSAGVSFYTFPWAATSQTTEAYMGVLFESESGWVTSLTFYKDIDEILGYYSELGIDGGWELRNSNKLTFGLRLGAGDAKTNMANLHVYEGGLADAVLNIGLSREVDAIEASITASYSSIVNQDIRDAMTSDTDIFTVTATITIDLF